MLVDRVLVVLVELQQAAGVAEGGNESLQHAGLVQVAQQLAQPRRDAQQARGNGGRPRRQIAAGSRGASWRTTSQVAGAIGLS